MRWFHRRDDEAFEALLTGESPTGGDEIAGIESFVDSLRWSYRDRLVPEPHPELAAFMDAPLITDKGDLPEKAGSNAYGPALVTASQVAGLPKWRESFTKRRTRMLSGLGSFLATVTGKVVLGGTVAAASVGGLHAGDVVDVPALPDNDPPAAEQADAQDDDADVADVADDAAENGEGAEDENGEGITSENVGDHAALFGLCNAWEANEDGRDDGDADEASPFQALQDAADAEGQSVEEFCEGVEPSNGQGEGVNGADVADDAAENGENGETRSEDARENGNAPDEVPPSEAGNQGDDADEERSTSTSQDASSEGDDADSDADDADDEGDSNADEANAEQRPDEVPPSDAGGSGPS